MIIAKFNTVVPCLAIDEAFPMPDAAMGVPPSLWRAKPRLSQGIVIR